MALKAVIWDMGGVLVRTEDSAPREALAKRLGLSRLELEEIVFSSESGRRAGRGEISSAEHYAWVAGAVGLSKGDLPEFIRDFWAGDRVDRTLVDFTAGLRPRLRTGLLSNAWSDARQVVEEAYRFLYAFDEIIFSAEVGLAKPDLRIYQMMLERLGVAPDEAVFIDDFTENITGAEMLGIRAIHFRQSEQALEDLGCLLSQEA